ncbi:hypothetical protein EWM64_g165 [Hericium alpestre]|uniref:tRNA-splicing endonuclease subunit Sen54 N-terminal domain-containing protein n=1 Tax=Hericium alpestre TaxID=135208 RepID=A0A4Z0A9U7_9AGAM|nr:hypothetical protein EWM64_g165 [Hericium alpestre]
MDDFLEEPRPEPIQQVNPDMHEDDEESSADEDGGLDWTKLSSLSLIKPVIPKRGEKDFEPTTAGGSGLQLHNLDRARNAMFEALGATRAISSRNVSYAIWYPSIARARITTARGSQLNTLGHSVARPTGSSIEGKIRKGLELLPEETLYLIEKGSLFCWKDVDTVPIEESGSEDAPWGVPMSVQQAFAELIGKEDLTLERYQVFSYLKRLGYSVMRAAPPSPAYPAAAPYPPTPKPASQRRSLFDLILSPLSPSLFRSLRFLQSGHSVPLRSSPLPSSESHGTSSPYKVFWHLYKPNTPFRKTAPPPPDFSIVVVNARTTPMPTLAEFTDLFKDLPIAPPPLPRQRRPVPSTAPAPHATQSKDGISKVPASQATLLHRLLSYVPFLSRRSPAEQNEKPVGKPFERRVNPFMALRQGNKIVVIAAVDAGSVSFFRFGEGAFSEWPMA